jgi:hypothetical protein
MAARTSVGIRGGGADEGGLIGNPLLAGAGRGRPPLAITGIEDGRKKPFAGRECLLELSVDDVRLLQVSGEGRPVREAVRTLVRLVGVPPLAEGKYRPPGDLR